MRRTGQDHQGNSRARHHHRLDRAHRACAGLGREPADRDEFRPDPGPGRSARGDGRCRACAKSIWASRCHDAAADPKSVGLLRRLPGAVRYQRHGRGRRDRRHHRRQRRRQDHVPARGRRRAADRAGHGRVRRPADRRQDAARDRAARHRHGAGRAPAVSEPVGGGKSAARRPQRARRAVESQTGLRAVSAAARIAPAAGAGAVGRPAADGGDRPRA